MSDKFAGYDTISSPASDWAAVVPSDTADLAPRPKGLYVTVAGNLSLVGDAGTVTFPVTVGQILPLRARRVRATGTTATVVSLF